MVDLASYGPIQWDGASPEEAAQVGHVVGRVMHWEQGIGKEFRERCERFYRQYRGFQRYRHEWSQVSPRDRDGLIYDAAKHWGAHLHIPMSFRTIETIVPRAIANMPKMLYAPRDEQWRKNVETVRLLINAQQAQISIDLPYQAVMRAGGMYGLGVGKTYWRTEKRTRRRMERHATKLGYVLGGPQEETTFDDPMFEDIDVFDFMWDPYGSDIETCEWTVHRRWMSLQAVLQRVESEAWVTDSAKKLNEDTVRSLGTGATRYTEIWQDRMAASGFNIAALSERGEQPHELLEFHNGERVLSVLDRQVLVQDGENACGEMPFQIYRPTPLGKQFVGIGWLEPIEHLNRELDTLRSQRRDAATMALNAGYAFDDGAIDRDDLVFGPAAAIPVTNASPKDALMPLQVRDVPGSGYQEEAAIMANIEAVSGEADALNNQQGGTEGTATEATLVQASLSARINLDSRRFETEVVRPSARQFLYLDQRMITKNRTQLAAPGQDGAEEGMPAGEWRSFPVGPGELLGEYEIEPLGGSMAARNIPQDRSDAQAILNGLAHDWYINPTKARLRAMELMGIEHPQSWLRDPTPAVPMLTLRYLVQAGVDPSLLVQSVLRAREQSAPQEGPSANQITEQVGVEGTQ